jgi:hypothetical protein
MEQRPLRLGDVVDDYCPRERRITNHAIVALVGDSIRQTRCTTCDTEHVYKEARVPRRRKKDETAALYEQVLADAGGGQLVHPDREEEAASADDITDGADAPGEPAPAMAVADDGPGEPPAENTVLSEDPGEPQPHDLWPAHRRLIRATLPRTENDPPAARPIPEFTMHQRPHQRGGQQFRTGNGWHGGNGNVNGNVAGPRHGGGRQGRPGDQGHGQPGQGSRKRHRGGRHRRPR